MGITAIPPGSGYPNEPVSLPHHVEISFQDDGEETGLSSIFINGRGYNASGQLDLKTFFGATRFRSYQLLSKFLLNAAATSDLIDTKWFRDVDLTWRQIYNGGLSGPGLMTVPLQTGPAPAGVAGINVVRSAEPIAGIWRLSIELRHTTGRF